MVAQNAVKGLNLSRLVAVTREAIIRPNVVNQLGKGGLDRRDRVDVMAVTGRKS